MDCSTPGPCASPSPEVHLSSCVLHQWCHLILDTLFSICPQLFPASGTFLTSQLFASDDQNTGVLASTSNPSNEYSELISLKSDWLNLLAVQATLRSLLQHHSLKASILRCSTFFTVQLSQQYVNTGKTIDLTIQSHVSAFQHTVWVCHSFPAKKQLSSDFMATVTISSDFRAQEEEICHYFHLCPLYLSWHNRARWMASQTWWTWVWGSSGSWWWTGKLGVL